MTCIIGIEAEGKVWMGGDSAAAEGWNIRQIAERKVFRRGNMLIGYTTSFRMGQLLQYELTMPKQERECDMQFLVASFIPVIRDLLARGGFTTIDNNKEDGGQFLVGYKGKLYCISGDFQVLRLHDGYDAIGCGAQYALGALGATTSREFTSRAWGPEEWLYCAMEVAARFCNGVSAPFYVESL